MLGSRLTSLLGVIIGAGLLEYGKALTGHSSLLIFSIILSYLKLFILHNLGLTIPLYTFFSGLAKTSKKSFHFPANVD